MVLMLLARGAGRSSLRCRPYTTTASGLRSVKVLADASINTFRRDAFDASMPALLPPSHFANLPAVHRWFKPAASTGQKTQLSALNTSYLSRFGSTIVPLEITNETRFARIEQSLSFFLECVNASTSTYDTTLPPSPPPPPPPARNRYFTAHIPGARAMRRSKSRSNDPFFFSSSAATSALAPPTAHIYLAQAPLADLPRALRQDLPTPEAVLQAGKGDVYDSSIWLGCAPTYTPLHRDPNPNLFVQLAGSKVVRLFTPEVGNAIFAKVQEKVGGSASPTMRGQEMMLGMEKEALEEEVWGKDSGNVDECWEATLGSGDGLFIPKGWWHSVRGMGEGMTGSVSLAFFLMQNVGGLIIVIGELVVPMRRHT